MTLPTEKRRRCLLPPDMKRIRRHLARLPSGDDRPWAMRETKEKARATAILSGPVEAVMAVYYAAAAAAWTAQQRGRPT